MQKELVELRSCSIMGLITLLKAFRNDSDLPAPWDTDLENASICLELALEKMRAELLGFSVGGHEDTGAGKVVGNSEAGRAADNVLMSPSMLPPQDPQPVRFSDFAGAERDEVLAEMVELRQVVGLLTPWENVQQLSDAIDGGYDPGNHFSLGRLPGGGIRVALQ